MTAGRPTEYREEYCERLIEMGKRGFSVTEMACALDISKQCLYEWEKKHPQFGDALMRARSEAQAWFERVGRDGLFADKFQASLWGRQMAARFPDEYREKTAVEHSGNLTLGGIVNDIDGRSAGLPSDQE